jgi:uncharacterized protein YtpQ (UPF0354 family)
MGVATRWSRRLLLATVPLLTIVPWLKTSAIAGARRVVDMTDLRDAVIAIVKRKPGVTGVVPDAGDPAKINMQVGGKTVTVDLTNLMNRIRAYPDEDAGELIAQFTAAIDDMQKQAVSEANLVAVLRDQAYVDQISKMKGGLLKESFVDGLVIVYMADMPGSMSVVTRSEFPRDVGEAHNIALNNVCKWLSRVKSDDRLRVTTLYFIEGNTLLSPTVILLDEFWTSIKGRYPGDVLIAVPRRDQLFIFNDNAEGPALARRMIDVTFKDNLNLLSDRIYARRNGKIVAVEG